MLVLKIVILAVVTAATFQTKKDFSGDQVLTIFPKTDGHVTLIKSLEKDHDQVDFWSPKYADGVGVDKAVDIHFARSYVENIKSFFEEQEIQYEVKIDNLQKMIDNQVKGRTGQTKDSLVHNYNVYHPLEEIDVWIQDIAAQYPSLVKVDVLGQSTEGRDIHMLTISTDLNNPAIMIDCTFHAREWISPAVCQCFTRNLLEGYGKDTVFTQQLNRLTYYIIPVVNVDGYVYSWETNRMWRKTRSNYGTPCTGVDPNRNCDANWGGEGASDNPCSDIYHGPHMESEPEVKVFADFLRAHLDHTMVYLSFHSYGQLYSLPYSRSYSPPPTLDVLEKYAEQSASAIADVFGTQYTWGPGSQNLYLVSGGSKDFAYDHGIPWAATQELRDTGEYGFLLPDDQIEHTCIETTAGVKALSDAALELYHNKKAP